MELSTAIDTFDAHGLRAQNDKVIDIPDMVTVLRSLYEAVQVANPTDIRLPLTIDLCLNWILNVYDRLAPSLSKEEAKKLNLIKNISQSKGRRDPRPVLQSHYYAHVPRPLGGEVPL